MKQKNFAAFFALCKKLDGLDDSKEDVVRSYTGGRTESLREMTDAEYMAMINDLRRQAGQPPMYRGYSGRPGATPYTRKLRSILLRQMQVGGINTADWAAVDRFCLDPRIAGKRFAELSNQELKEAHKRVLAIKHKQKKKDEQTPDAPAPKREKKDKNEHERPGVCIDLDKIKPIARC